jgi:hypothetical protein
MNSFQSIAKNFLMRQAPLQRLAARFGAVPRVDKWVFIIGCYNSGTTLLARLLARHSQVRTMPGEGVAFTDGLLRPEEFGWPRLWYRCQQEMQVDGGNRLELANRIKKQWGFAACGNGPVFLEKSIANATRLEFLDKYFTPAYFIHITRNGYAVAEGIRRKTNPARWQNQEFGERYPIACCAEQWKATEDLIHLQSAGLEHYHALSYEDLSQSPEREIRKIIEFLGLSPEAGLIDKEVLVHGERRPISNLNRPSLDSLSAAEIAEIERAAGELLARYNYTP